MATMEVEHGISAGNSEVTRLAMEAIRTDLMLAGFSALSDPELMNWCGKTQSGLTAWTAGEDPQCVSRICYELGTTGATHGIPLPEMVRALILVLNLSGRHVRPSGALDHADMFTGFRDFARYYLVRGYEDAIR